MKPKQTKNKSLTEVIGKCCICKEKAFGILNKKQYCSKHFEMEKREIKYQRKDFKRPICGVMGYNQRNREICKNPVWFNGMCQFHYNKLLKNNKDD